jgi:hypothetical protein
MKPTNGQQHYVVIPCTEFYPKETKNAENTGISVMEATIAHRRYVEMLYTDRRPDLSRSL